MTNDSTAGGIFPACCWFRVDNLHMTAAAKLRLGYIPYLNCVPFFHFLREVGFQGTYISGVPAELNRMLQRGQLDISPSSSFEYARNWRDYLLLPHHSISSYQQVKSVLLFSPVDLEKLDGCNIAITGESATSINLMRIIFREFCQLKNVSDRIPNEKIEQLIYQRKPALLIGDRALQLAADCPADIKIFDLGEIWYQHTGLPFVFALWMICRKSLSTHCGELSQLGGQLTQARERLDERSLDIAVMVAQKVGLRPETVVDYWQTIDYHLEDDHLRSLKLFFSLCKRYRLLNEEPELNFWNG